MMVMNCTLDDSGRQALCITASATSFASIIGSMAISPLACGTALAMRAGSSASAFPMSICPQAMLYLRPSSEIDLVRPVIVCLVEMKGAELGRGACAEIEPLLIMRPHCGCWSFIILKAFCAHRSEPVRLMLTMFCQWSNVMSSNSVPTPLTPVLLKSTSSRPNVSLIFATGACHGFLLAHVGGHRERAVAAGLDAIFECKKRLFGEAFDAEVELTTRGEYLERAFLVGVFQGDTRSSDACL